MEDMESKSFTFCEEQYIEYFWVYEIIKLMYLETSLEQPYIKMRTNLSKSTK